MIQSWKPVYKQCDFVIGHNKWSDLGILCSVLRDELEASDVQFKARRQPNETDEVDATVASRDTQFNNHQRRRIEDTKLISLKLALVGNVQ